MSTTTIVMMPDANPTADLMTACHYVSCLSCFHVLKPTCEVEKCEKMLTRSSGVELPCGADISSILVEGQGALLRQE